MPRALVIGYGRMGVFHRKALADLGYDVTTVDPDPAAGADRLEAPAGHGFDVVCVATPIPWLAETAAGWAGRTDHLLVEKPMAGSVAEAAELRRALLGQPTAVGFVERFNPQVRALRARLAGVEVGSAMFIRWNDRPSADVPTDLTSHDVDLARFLGVERVAVFDSRAGSPVKRREISVTGGFGRVSVDLMGHQASPLHAQWHAFLARRFGYATPADGVAALQGLLPFQARSVRAAA